MIVVDASAFIEIVVASDAGRETSDLIATERALAPSLLDAEVLHRLVTFEKRDVLTEDEVDTAIVDLMDAPIERIDHRPLLSDARTFAAAASGYDALYVALAARLGCRLVTTDTRLARTVVDQFGLDVEVPTRP